MNTILSKNYFVIVSFAFGLILQTNLFSAAKIRSCSDVGNDLANKYFALIQGVKDEPKKELEKLLGLIAEAKASASDKANMAKEPVDCKALKVYAEAAEKSYHLEIPAFKGLKTEKTKAE